MTEFYKEVPYRTMFNAYYDISELDVGTIPYTTIERALKYPIFLIKHIPTPHWTYDLKMKHYSSVLVRFPEYRDYLYEYALQGKSYKEFFSPYDIRITESFEYLFPHVIKQLDKLIKNRANLDNGLFEEIKLSKL